MRKKETIKQNLKDNDIIILPPSDVIKNLKSIKKDNIVADAIIFDPWYFKEKEISFQGVSLYNVACKEWSPYIEYKKFIKKLLKHGSEVSNHMFLWGFPEIAADFLSLIPEKWALKAWLTWFYRNNQRPSDAWLYSQNTCLHLAKKGSNFYPNNFKNKKPYDVIEAELVGPKNGYRYQGEKNIDVYKQLILMSTPKKGLVIDFMCGSGTTAEAAKESGRKAIISDISDEAISLSEKRLSMKRIQI